MWQKTPHTRTWEEEDGYNGDGTKVDGRGHVAGGPDDQPQALGNQTINKTELILSIDFR